MEEENVINEEQFMKRVKELQLKTNLLTLLIKEKRIDDLRAKVSEIREAVAKFEEDKLLYGNMSPGLMQSINYAVEAAVNTTDIISDSIDLGASSVSVASIRNEFEKIDSVKLPELKPAIYNGDMKAWRPWWEQFEAAIHSKSNLSSSSKFTYLLSCLKGRARQAIEGYSPTAENYPEVIRVLKDRFGNPAKLVAIYYKELDDIASASEADDQRSNFDTISKILKNLSNIGTVVDQEYLKSLILRKFSRPTIKNTLKYLIDPTNNKQFSVEELMEALSKVVTIDELTEMYLNEGRNHKKISTTSALVASSNGDSKGDCHFCNGYHLSQDCRRYPTLAARKERLLTKKCCFACGKPGHLIKVCSKKGIKCSLCKKAGHAAFLCVQYLVEKNRKKNPKEKEIKGTYLETFSCVVVGPHGNISVRGILDNCSLKSYVHDSLVNKLGLKFNKKKNLQICHFGSNESQLITSSKVMVALKNNSGALKVFRFQSTNCITGNITTSPSVEINKKILPQHLNYADSEIFRLEPKEIEILIGSDYYHDIVNISDNKTLPCNVKLINSFFGWVPSGKIKCTSDNEPYDFTVALSCSNIKHTSVGKAYDLDLDKLWSLETIGIKTLEKDEVEEFVLEQFRKTVKFENNRYVVRWPWKIDYPKIPSNFRMSMARLKSLLKNTSCDTLLQMDTVLKEQEESGIIEKAPRKTSYVTHYLPHRPIFRNNKIRIVYDASAKTKNGSSLNEFLHKGPNLTKNIVELLLNFRLNAIGLTADIEKAYLQIGLNEVDRDAVRFLWVKNISNPISSENLIVFRFARVPFGVISSPFLLNIVLQDLLATSPDNQWCTLGSKRFYVDNLVISVKDTSEALNLYNSLTSKLKYASFNLRDWDSNDESFVNIVKCKNHLEKNISVLGLNWNRQKDIISIKSNLEEKDLHNLKASKRNVLKFLASIYDPLGLLAPSTLEIKVFLQECWKKKYNWDSVLPPNLEARWSKLFLEANEIFGIEIKRRYWSHQEEGNISLHVFCDASKKAYACAAYLSYDNEVTGCYSSALIFSKIRTAPLKEISIPRLELLAVLIGKRAANFLSSSLEIKLKKIVIWTDATTVLQWLNTTSVLPKFVQNRIEEIRKSENLIFRYVPTSCNPADIATRGMKAEQLKNNNLWWYGPSWISCEKLWPTTPNTTEIFITPSVVLVTGVIKYSGIISDELEKRFSKWNAYIRLFRNIMNFGCRKSDYRSISNVEKFRKAERMLILELQRKYFLAELNKLKNKIQPNFQLNLEIDQDGLIRCRGRLQNIAFPWDTINPILLPRESPIIRTLIHQLHIENHHIGCNHLLAKLRERFWIVKGRAKVKSVISQCLACKRWSGGSYKLPPLPPLPLVRVAEASPFLHTGVDFISCLNIRNDFGNKIHRVNVVLFTCLVVRAVHLEIVRDMSGDEFLMALSRFTSRRGVPKFLISDNASTFSFVQPLVSTQIVKMSDYKLDLFLSSNNIQWKFIPTYAPWYGGAYERLIGLVKICLKKSYGSVLLNYTQLQTSLCQIEDTINSRPLTYTSEEMVQALTPNHFLRIRTCNVNENLKIASEKLQSNRINLITAYMDASAVTNAFWEAFKSHYLLSLRERHCSIHPPKKGEVSFVPQKGDVVLVEEPLAPRSQWRYGIIKEVDVRKALAKVFSNGKDIVRTINQLYPLEISSKENNNL